MDALDRSRNVTRADLFLKKQCAEAASVPRLVRQRWRNAFVEAEP